eukprot:5194933-Alexandrium_andersonii.AAC.1
MATSQGVSAPADSPEQVLAVCLPVCFAAAIGFGAQHGAEPPGRGRAGWRSRLRSNTWPRE